MMDLTHPELIYDNQKEQLSEIGKFESISTKDKHDYVLRDQIFGESKLSYDNQKWIYVAKARK